MIAKKIGHGDDGKTVWVPSWSQLKLPELVNRSRHLDLFVCHNLLLHAGLPTGGLGCDYSVSGEQVGFALQRMSARGLVELEDGRWRITAAAYPSVRAVLDSEGYLVDGL